MNVMAPPVTFRPMARKESTEATQQVNFRLKTATVERMERFKERHPLHPTLTQIVEAAVTMWLDHEGDDPKQKRAK